ncbi:MAG: hypothetical protein KA319_00865 [Ferruginibacter sp.]|nr:hypothetical protein [Ferruginibacter sp.]
MKKISIAILLASLFCVSAQVNAQLGNLLKKIKKDKGGDAASSNSNSKKEITLFSVMLLKDRRVSDDGKTKIIIEDLSTTSASGQVETLIKTTYVGRMGQKFPGVNFRKELVKDELFFDYGGDQKYLKKINNNTMATYQLHVKYKKFATCSAADLGVIEIFSNDEALIDGIINDSKNSEGLKLAISEFEKTLPTLVAIEKEEEAKELIEWEKTYANVVLPKLAEFQPKTIKQKAGDAVKAAMAKFQPTEELLYFYFAVKDREESNTGWNLVKGYKDGHSDVVIKRTLPIVAVSVTKSGKYSYNYFYLKEDAQVGVIDGSKFTGIYYIDVNSAHYGIAKANAMANKGK